MNYFQKLKKIKFAQKSPLVTPGYYFPVVPEQKLLKKGEPGIMAIFILFVTDGYTVPALGNLVINVDALSSDYLKLSSKLLTFLNFSRIAFA